MAIPKMTSMEAHFIIPLQELHKSMQDNFAFAVFQESHRVSAIKQQEATA